MSSTSLVNLKGHRDTPDYYDVYIGRAMFMGGWKLSRSIWANPFTIKECGSATQACINYETWIKTQPHLMARLHELRGKRLACWCTPGPCHGQVLMKLLD